MPISIAIDGPSGAGKSTIARIAAKKLGYIYIDTGALYRAIGCYASQNGIDTRDGEKVSESLAGLTVEIKFISGEQRVLANGEDISEKIRTPQMAMHASNVSAIPKVREFLLDLQRNFAKKNNVIMDGRDIGTVILPNAQVKIFLTAAPEERARRRLLDHQRKGEQIEYDEILKQIIERDYNDSHRETAPLKQADDAVFLDTTEYDLEQSVQAVLDIIEKRLKEQ